MSKWELTRKTNGSASPEETNGNGTLVAEIKPTESKRTRYLVY
ncbi:uncharacterized protein PITG_01254 [Phytophthora infestans T30-4]|uniref:Uncharacterized protein n=1 Tax=Phytophthora infestans (strain T30-4) TaxID=403677 RepID=D0MV14_PHYIT|nr:uncharacterized protein PITG_01254 [Phytophthora infestans T30-4]EEY61010.1 hypothetical protein PITG_01254 [Phytophthora infestans T30-4]|eukprot:XP_002907927.1 hypothetical protein PITG_01254 [Phytophthora infestans T30-4]